jgi:oxygen-independent coproporphyrinogen-3 oxidase
MIPATPLSVLRQGASTMSLFNESLIWNPELLRRYDLSGPRYTSYPTAPQFSESFSRDDLLSAIERSNAGQAPLSLYFHIPFCDTLCFYCGCNKIVTHQKSRAQPYLECMDREMAMIAAHVDTARKVTQLHWGGGTPTYLSEAEMSWLMQATGRHFQLVRDDSAEYSIEIHPGRVPVSTMRHLRGLGFNRVSMGVQDFDERVQRAVNRFNSVEEVGALVDELRRLQFHSISMDLIYGLPLQTVSSIEETLNKVIDLSPDRLSLFNYAHMPHLFKSQSLINESELPLPAEKLEMLHRAIEMLERAGYVYIGMDHFAKPDDSLVLAQQAGKLQRNFQGYSTHGECDLFSFGVSAISAYGDVYVQNVKRTERYQELIDSKILPLARGFHLSREDRLRQFVINQLICHFHLDFSLVEQRFDIDFNDHFASELAQLAPMQEDALLSVSETAIQVNNTGRLLIRRICMVFDAYLSSNRNAPSKDERIRFSRII